LGCESPFYLRTVRHKTPGFLKKLGFSLSPADSTPGHRYDSLSPA